MPGLAAGERPCRIGVLQRGLLFGGRDTDGDQGNDPEPLTPVAVEQKLRQLVTDLSRAQIALAQARDEEVDRRYEYERARRKTLLSANHPK